VKPLTLEEVNRALVDAGLPTYCSAEEPYVNGVVMAIAERSILAEAGFIRATAESFPAAHLGAPIGFVIARANRILAELPDDSFDLPPSAHHDAGLSDAEPLAEPTPASPLVSGEPSCVSGRAADAGISSEGNP